MTAQLITARLAVVLTAVFGAGCSAPAGYAPVNVAASNLADLQPNSFRLDPARRFFKSPQQSYKREYVHGYIDGGAFNSDCFTRGIAEVDGDGLKGNTGIFDVIPLKSGRCSATFRNAHGESLTLRITIGT